MNKTPLSQTLLAWAGVIAPLLFVAIFTLEGCLRIGYKPLGMYVSELALGPRGWIQNINFIVFGFLFFVFTRCIAAVFQNGKASRWGIILLTIIAICYLGFGFLVMDPLATPHNEITFHGLLHFLMGEIVLVLMPVSCFVFLQRFRGDANWRFLQWWTLVLGIIIAIASILLIAAMNIPDVQKLLHDWLGLIQRASIVPFMLWLFIFALGILRQREPFRRH
jgi:Protein of unknown function (DUF998)